MPKKAPAKRDSESRALRLLQATDIALDRMRTLYAAVGHMREVSAGYGAQAWVTPQPSEWDIVLVEIRDTAQALLMARKGRA